MRIPVPIVAFFALLVSVAAAASAPPAASEACTLVTRADVQAAVGVAASDPTPNSSNAAVCDFKVGDYGVVSFLVRSPGPGETADKMIAELKQRGVATAEAPGTGDRSFFASPGYGMVQLNSFKGTSYVILTMLVPGATEAAQRDAAVKLMRKALAKR